MPLEILSEYRRSGFEVLSFIRIFHWLCITFLSIFTLFALHGLETQGAPKDDLWAMGIFYSSAAFLAMTLVGAFCAPLVWLWRRNKYLAAQTLPPGPIGYPIVGSLFHVDPQKPFDFFQALAQEHGRICKVYMGSKLFIIVTDPGILRKLFAKTDFCGRAPLDIPFKMMEGCGLIAAEGEHWSIQRQFTAKFMKEVGMRGGNTHDRKQMEERLLNTVRSFVDDLCEGESISLDTPLQQTIGNMLNDIIFGQQYPPDDPKWQRIQFLRENGVKQLKMAQASNLIPFLSLIFRGKLNEFAQGIKETHSEYQRVIDVRKKDFDSAGDYHGPKCLVGEFLKAKRNAQMKDPQSAESHSFSDKQLCYLAGDIFGAGIDTTVNTIQWCILYLCKRQLIQQELYNDIKTRCGSIITLHDKHQLVHLQAFIFEVMRMKPAVPMGVPHGTTRTVDLEGYTIPKGATIIPLQWAINGDEEFWDVPTVFDPKRFLVSPEESEKELRPNPHFIPFQVGKRRCVGEEFGLDMIFLFLANFLQRFRVQLPRDDDNYDLNCYPDFAFTLHPVPYRVELTARRD
ncbi:cytochrome P450 18a1-like [Tigriopus californicus]|uniref:cytochrome P450 18a1-like n=1 Tax=Tigriopus californicus TaxID=6832 RepID=UPI0027DA4381|nr:cytochrome P450 18a1-like [Tigriopus californicus]|eukprot:TCALIF_10576-PA protein Name:"Similar to phm Cytochrome P450 306a1 (Drosophila melanogaster)" AED:0.33 eAED:0.33 QI:71/1/0.8/1/0.5/0.6/5/445/567